MTIISFTVNGALEAFIMVPLLSMIIESIQESENCGENEFLNDKASSLFNSVQALGCIAGPISGGLLNDRFGFKATVNIINLVILFYTFIFFVTTILPDLREKMMQKNWIKSVIVSKSGKIEYSTIDFGRLST